MPATSSLLNPPSGIAAVASSLLRSHTGIVLVASFFTINLLASPFHYQNTCARAQVGEGINEFIPSPEETRQLLASDYSVPSTLLIRFADDTIDESDALAETLRIKYPSSKDGGRPGGLFAYLPIASRLLCVDWSPESCWPRV